MKPAYSLLAFYSLLIGMSFKKSCFCTNKKTEDCQMNNIMKVGVNETVEEVCTRKIKILISQKKVFFKHCYKSEATFLKCNRITNAKVCCSVVSQNSKSFKSFKENNFFADWSGRSEIRNVKFRSFESRELSSVVNLAKTVGFVASDGEELAPYGRQVKKPRAVDHACHEQPFVREGVVIYHW